MNQELGFETIPFEIAPGFQGEVFEEESERGGRRSSPGPELPAPFPLHRPDNVRHAGVWPDFAEEATGTKAQT